MPKLICLDTRIAPIFAICLCSCSDSAKPIALANSFEAPTLGEAFALTIIGNTLSFCANSGGHEVNLQTGKVLPRNETCPAKLEANTACSGLPADPSVRSTPNQPDEIIDFNGRSYPLQGRVQDCVSNGSRLAIATNATVLWLDSSESGTHIVQQSGADRIAISGTWIAWTSGNRLLAKAIH